jgi:hypothetical protein
MILKIRDNHSRYKFVAAYVLYGVCIQTYVLIFVILRSLADLCVNNKNMSGKVKVKEVKQSLNRP